MNGISVVQPAIHNNYSISDFDDDLRHVLRRTCRGEKICFLVDEEDVYDASFLERMNTLLANSEIPGLFEGDSYTSLMSSCKEMSQRNGLNLDSHEDLYKWFCSQIVRNLHVVFTMNPSKENQSSRALVSPALFNRCVINWMGDWVLII
jgi:dynein heavy chain 1